MQSGGTTVVTAVVRSALLAIWESLYFDRFSFPGLKEGAGSFRAGCPSFFDKVRVRLCNYEDESRCNLKRKAFGEVGTSQGQSFERLLSF